MHDVRALDARRRLRLPLEALDELGVLRVLRHHELDRDLGAEREVLGDPYGPHGA
jgi:hypothetical protein